MASCTCSSWLMFLVPNSNCFKFNALVASQTQWHTHSRNIPQFKRHWVEASDQSLASPYYYVPERFSVASYNILGGRNASQHSDLYVNVPSRYINWAHRKRIISDELFGWDPDIICLQEVDKYFELSDIMVKAGYAGSYKVYWKERPFNIRTLAQLSVFEMCKSDSRRLLVGNIHVLYNPNRGEVKLGQIRFLLSRAQYLSEKWGNTPVVLAGDFNSTPQSGIYKFLSSSEDCSCYEYKEAVNVEDAHLKLAVLNVLLYYRKELSGQKRCRPAQVLGENKQTVGPIVTLYGYFSISFLGSNCTQGFNGELLATSYHSKFLGTVDYLWYSDGIVPSRVLDTVSISDLLRTGGLPCKKVGSDHLALVSEFSFSVTNNEPKDKVAAAAAAAAAASPIVDIEEPNNQQS
ncbi:Carbon catabolite repressor protein 4 3 [Glycine max]|nr:Carbon catabolite repressor protein 4 3 [Glycine max]